MVGDEDNEVNIFMRVLVNCFQIYTFLIRQKILGDPSFVNICK